MMKKIVWMTLVYGFSLLASDSSSLEQKLKELEKRNKQQAEMIASLQDQLDMLDEKVEDVETSTLIDKVKLNLGFRVKMDNFHNKMADGTKVDANNIWSTKFTLGMYADIADNMKFHGRLSMYKYWADSTKHMYSQYDNMQGRVPSDSSLYLERAYVDWYFNAFVPSALTIGRQPSADGPSHQFKENTTRKSTYSALVFDGASDGIVYTANVAALMGIKEARLRLAYGKGFQNDETRIGVTNAFIGPANDTLKDTNVAGVFFESALFGLDNSLFQIGYVRMSDVIANAMETNSSKNVNIGDIDFAGVMAETANLHKSGWDLFAHVGVSSAKPNAKLYHYGDFGFGLLRDNGADDTDTKNGYAYWLGARYNFENFNKSKIGFEFNHGSKYWVTATQGSYDMYNKLSTRGDAYEMYGIYPINRYSFIKVGGIYIDYTYTDSGWYQKKPKKIADLPVAQRAGIVDTLSSIYLQFSVRF